MMVMMFQSSFLNDHANPYSPTFQGPLYTKGFLDSALVLGECRFPTAACAGRLL